MTAVADGVQLKTRTLMLPHGMIYLREKPKKMRSERTAQEFGLLDSYLCSYLNDRLLCYLPMQATECS